MIKHSQYYTSKSVATLMVKHLQKGEVKTIIDLGAGDGALACAAIRKWDKAVCYAVDIDEKNCQRLEEQGFESRNVDCNASGLDVLLGIDYDSIDVGVCNPPYITIDNNEFILNLLERAQLKICRKERYSTSDLVFLAYNLLFLKPHGILGIIVPYSIMAGRNYCWLRQSLLENYYVERVIELPEKSFSYTEAKTGILIIRKENSNGRRTKLNTIVDNYNLSESLYVSISQLTLRLDYSYYHWKKTQSKTKYRNNNEISIIRGRYSHDELKKKGCPYFHTTSYKCGEINWYYPYKESEKSIVEQGGFLIARVGKRCVGRVKYIEDGHIQVSDCVYGVMVPSDYIEHFKTFFQSQEYSDFIKIASRGVCSLYLCKGDLESILLKKLHEFKS